jgi:hypothetical protein
MSGGTSPGMPHSLASAFSPTRVRASAWPSGRAEGSRARNDAAVLGDLDPEARVSLGEHAHDIVRGERAVNCVVVSPAVGPPSAPDNAHTRTSSQNAAQKSLSPLVSRQSCPVPAGSGRGAGADRGPRPDGPHSSDRDRQLGCRRATYIVGWVLGRSASPSRWAWDKMNRGRRPQGLTSQREGASGPCPIFGYEYCFRLG